MAKISKNRKAILAKYDAEKEYSLEDASKVLKRYYVHQVRLFSRPGYPSGR